MITSKRGFTLIELLLVVVIIGIVAAFVLPKFGDVKEKAYVSAMKNDLRNLATEQEIYFDNHTKYMPSLTGISGVIDRYTTSEDVLVKYNQQYEVHGYITGNAGRSTDNGYVANAFHDDTNIQCVLNRQDGTIRTRVFNADGSEPIQEIEEGGLFCGN